ncbi:GDP-mannose 4,6-dehydratase [bacterium]|nr:GDP-mannose 4,6-dehydratase [bacterium]
MTTALVVGVSGQDGSLLSKFLLEKGSRVIGASRDPFASSMKNLETLSITSDIELVTMVPEDISSVFAVVQRYQPDEIYFLSGQSSVGLSFTLPLETINSFVQSTLSILEVCRQVNPKIRQYHAGSSECFGDIREGAAAEDYPFNPMSPYAVGKASAYWLVKNYRAAYGLHASTGILFNHESTLRPERYVTQKIVRSALAISEGRQDRLELGRLDIRRDWGWAPEYVEAMWKITQQNDASDYVVATGKSHTLQQFVEVVFQEVGLDWNEHVVVSERHMRPADIQHSCGDASSIKRYLDWEAVTTMPQVARNMVNGVL